MEGGKNRNEVELVVAKFCREVKTFVSSTGSGDLHSISKATEGI